MNAKGNATIDKDCKSVARLIQSAADCGEVDTYAGKRHTARVSEGVQLEVTEDLSQKSFAVSMHNVSETGCAFWIKRKMEIHTPLFLREFTPDDSAPWVPACVTHCTQGIRGFLIGVSFGATPK
jgi:hypothetical protein